MNSPDTAYHPTRHWHRIAHDRVQCDLCPRACQLHDGQRGLCYVRMNHNDALVLTTYGRSSGFGIDPIEKKPLHHFLPGSAVLSFGTAGCNLTCRFCQNWDISKSREAHTLTRTASPERIARTAADMGCSSVAFTYNDPVIFHEYAVDTAHACRELGIRTVAVTAGYVSPEPRAEFFAAMDAANIDLKAFSGAFYSRLCGADIEVVKDTLRYVRRETGVWLEITTLLIPGENDSDAEIHALAAWIAEELGPDVPLHLSAFHPEWRMRTHPATPASTLSRARRIAGESGLRYVYTGNIRDRDGGSTCCHGCGHLLIGRDCYDITRWTLTGDARCPSCGDILAGVFEAVPGSWGAKRMPVDIRGSD